MSELLTQVPQIRPLADIVHYKYIFTYLLTYLMYQQIVICRPERMFLMR